MSPSGPPAPTESASLSLVPILAVIFFVAVGQAVAAFFLAAFGDIGSYPTYHAGAPVMLSAILGWPVTFLVVAVCVRGMTLRRFLTAMAVSTSVVLLGALVCIGTEVLYPGLCCTHPPTRRFLWIVGWVTPIAQLVAGLPCFLRGNLRWRR